MTRHWRAIAERWNRRMQEHAQAGHPAHKFVMLDYPAGTPDGCEYCGACMGYFKAAVAQLADQPKHLKEAKA